MAELFVNDTIGNLEKADYRRWLEERHKKNRQWWYLPAWHITIGCMPKCGTSTLYNAIADNNLRCFNPVEFEGRCIWVVRDPIERFISLWKNKCRDGGRVFIGDNHRYLEGLSMDELMTLIEEEEVLNTHWARQADVEGGRATELIPLENLSEWWDNEGYPPLEVKNSTKGDVELPPEIEERVRAYYAKDIELYERAVREYEARG